MKKTIIIIISIFLLIFGYIGYINYVNNASMETLSRYGSTGNEVRQIQTRLKSWGYYNGAVDGIYGSKTQAAVRAFQKANGLTVDGVAGPKTLEAIGLPTGSTSSRGGGSASNSSDLNLLAHLVYGEARGEEYIGQVAVAAVVLNRVKSSSFPNTVAGVIYQRGAFDVVSDGQINLAPNKTAISAARDALNRMGSI